MFLEGPLSLKTLSRVNGGLAAAKPQPERKRRKERFLKGF